MKGSSKTDKQKNRFFLQRYFNFKFGLFRVIVYCIALILLVMIGGYVYFEIDSAKDIKSLKAQISLLQGNFHQQFEEEKNEFDRKWEQKLKSFDFAIEEKMRFLQKRKN